MARPTRVFVIPLLVSLVVGGLGFVPVSADAQILIRGLRVNQPAPIEIEEGHRAGWELSVSIDFTIRPGTTAQGFWFWAYVPDGIGAPKASLAGPGGSCNLTTGEPDIIVQNGDWIEAHGADLRARFTLPAAEPGEPVETVEDTFTFAFGTVCDDTKVEPQEAFTIRAGVVVRAVGTADGTQTTSSLSQPILINDDDSLA